MDTIRVFYLCPTCFAVSETAGRCHNHVKVCCSPGRPGDERRKPLMDADGRLKSRAPRWFLEAIQPLARHYSF
ncbi:MAG TPA: hypothetical protein VF177_15480 [Anaerolineae bacterium]